MVGIFLADPLQLQMRVLRSQREDRLVVDGLVINSFVKVNFLLGLAYSEALDLFFG